jgi:hypothetical protein
MIGEFIIIGAKVGGILMRVNPTKVGFFMENYKFQ